MNSYNKIFIIIIVDHTGCLDDLVKETIDRVEQGTPYPSLKYRNPYVVLCMIGEIKQQL